MSRSSSLRGLFYFRTARGIRRMMDVPDGAGCFVMYTWSIGWAVSKSLSLSKSTVMLSSQQESLMMADMNLMYARHQLYVVVMGFTTTPPQTWGRFLSKVHAVRRVSTARYSTIGNAGTKNIPFAFSLIPDCPVSGCSYMYVGTIKCSLLPARSECVRTNVHYFHE